MGFIDYTPPPKNTICRSSGHNPPAYVVLQPGTHKWKCDACGHVQTIVVPGTLGQSVSLTSLVSKGPVISRAVKGSEDEATC